MTTAERLACEGAAAKSHSVLVIDDSVVARAVFSRIIDASGDFVVTGSVSTAAAALEFLSRSRVDIILLDIAMPGMDGLTALPKLLAKSEGARVLVVSSSATDGARTTIAALAQGAADTLVKPPASSLAAGFESALLTRLRALTGAPRSLVRGSVSIPELPAMPMPVDSAPFDVIAIGASTGGIHALSLCLREIPLAVTTPILITQHLPASFVPYFAAQVAVLAKRPCDVAEDRMRIRPGRVIVAPGNAHMRCVTIGPGGAAIRLSTGNSVSGCLPSVDPMLQSLADVYGVRSLAIILSGMGSDGAMGARAVHQAGGVVIAQDQTSSVVWGMPGVVVTQGSATAVLSPDAIGRFIAARQRA